MATFPADRILVPVDFSDGSWAAVEEARGLVRDPDGLHVVHVLLHLSALEPGMSWGTIDDHSRMRSTHAALSKALTERGVGEAHVHVELSVGNPAHRITELAQELEVDAIVLPSHGRTGMARLATGSVAERVVRWAHVPVLVIRH